MVGIGDDDIWWALVGMVGGDDDIWWALVTTTIYGGHW